MVISTQLKLCLATAIHNFNWVEITWYNIHILYLELFSRALGLYGNQKTSRNLLCKECIEKGSTYKPGNVCGTFL